LPTPENFPAPGTPPPQPPAELKPPDLQADNPVIPSGYDDKDGSALMNFDFDALPESEKGWKKPGAHLADWFNYGFDETTWRTYVMKQKRLHKEEGWAASPFAVCIFYLLKVRSSCPLIHDRLITGFRHG
jgi:pre-mRNA 3'-end-processing factor FIP1